MERREGEAVHCVFVSQCNNHCLVCNAELLMLLIPHGGVHTLHIYMCTHTTYGDHRGGLHTAPVRGQLMKKNHVYDFSSFYSDAFSLMLIFYAAFY
jgi:hypothetical protein